MTLAHDIPGATGKQRLTKPFMRLGIAAGAAVCLFSAYNLPFSSLGLHFLLFAFVTVAVGSRIGIQIPHVKAEITVSDTFIFLMMLLYDGEAAILVAAADALFSSLRFSKKWLTRLFNASLLACSTFLTVWTLRLCFGSIRELITGDYSAPFVIAICVMAFVQYVANSGLAALRESFKINQPFWTTWKTYYLWTSVTYFAGASAAGVSAKLISVVGLYAFVVTVPIIAIVYFTYRTYRQNLESAERHIEEQRNISEALRQSEEHYRNAFEHFHSAFDHAFIGMALIAPDGRWLQVNNSLCELVGYAEPELLTMNVQAIIHPDDLGQGLTDIYRLSEGKAVTASREQQYIHKSGRELWVMVSTSVVRDAQGKPIHLIEQVQDISERRRAEQQLQHAAFHDSLTKLPNRVSFTEQLRLTIERAKGSDDQLYAVLFLDCDRFKNINDSLGHALGDQFLIAIAGRLQKCLRPGDSVARLGGDEFAVLLNDMQHFTDAIVVAERIQKELKLPFNLGGHEVFTSASIGIALSTQEYDQPNRT